MPDGWCPFAVRRDDVNTYGYPPGTHGQNRPLVFVDHIIDGWKRTLDRGDWRLNNSVGVHFGIGRDGSISQYASIFDAHWGNGLVGAASQADRRGIERYDRSNRHLAAIEEEGTWQAGSGNWWLSAPSGGSLLNQRSISTEHEGFPFDKSGFDATWPEEMIEATIRIKRWCLEELERKGLPMMADDDLLIGHFQIDGVNRVNCPGPEWPRGRILADVSDSKQEEQDMAKLIQSVDGDERGPYYIVGSNGRRRTLKSIAELRALVKADVVTSTTPKELTPDEVEAIPTE